MNNPQLFDVQRLGPVECPVCSATRQPDQPRATQCEYDRDITLRRRPAACINTTDPATAPFPEGY
jgi:hypothetical protein